MEAGRVVELCLEDCVEGFGSSNEKEQFCGISLFIIKNYIYLIPRPKA